ncbi:MAG: UDP-3-O-(3-hydroxymyristoyl)glucosamine N-acyltransferase, partial [Opitutaceae bacterium]|nr:UDP-3-O-(3-hydroxymyristoyl)glucosamine N-acyltransferase [Opitutaceae bacterium]
MDYDKSPQEGQIYLRVENPSYAVAKICSKFEQILWPKPKPGVHSTAVIGEGCEIDTSATIGPLCVIESNVRIGSGSYLQASVFIGRGCEIGEECWLMPQTTIREECVLKDRIRLHSGVVIGSDGFGYETVEGCHAKVPQIGNVLIESDVEIGANTTIDRARLSSTLIGEGTKIDNQVQVGHNVVIGKHCFLCGQVGISGSTTLGDYVVLAG